MAQDGPIARREGPAVQEYMDDLVQHLAVRAGFNYDETVATPRHLQNLLNELEFNRVPRRVWNGLMTAALRITTMSATINRRLREFGAFFIDVLVWLCRRLVQSCVLQIALFLHNWLSNPLIKLMIMVIYRIIDSQVEPLWHRLSVFIHSRLITAPYYHHFAIV